MPYVLNRKTPQGIDTVVRVKAKQRELGVEPDGVWGSVTEAAYQRSLAGGTHAQQPLTMAGLKLTEQEQGTQASKWPTYEGKTSIESRLMDMDALEENSANAGFTQQPLTMAGPKLAETAQEEERWKQALADALQEHNEQKLAEADAKYRPSAPLYHTVQPLADTSQQPLNMARPKLTEPAQEEERWKQALADALREHNEQKLAEADTSFMGGAKKESKPYGVQKLSYMQSGVADPSSLETPPVRKTDKQSATVSAPSYETPLYGLGTTYTKEAWELAALRLSPTDAARYLNEVNDSIGRIKRAIQTEDLTISQSKGATLMLKVLEDIKNMNPQLAAAIAQDILEKGVKDISKLKKPGEYSYIISQGESFSRQDQGRYYEQLKEWALDHAQNSSLGEYEIERITQYITDASDTQLDKLADILAAGGFRQKLTDEDMQIALRAECGTAQLVNTNTVSITQESSLRPQINYPKDLAQGTAFSYYYYDKGSYYTDIYYAGVYEGRIDLGKKLPKMVTIDAERGPGLLDFDDQMQMATNLYIQSFLAFGMDATISNKGPISISDGPPISNALDELFPLYVNNIDENTIKITANIWRPTRAGNDRVVEGLLIHVGN